MPHGSMVPMSRIMKHVAVAAFLCTLSLGLTFLLALRQPARFEQHPLWTSEEDPATRPFATLKERTITLHPSEATFLIPQDWLDWQQRFGNNLHLSHKQLDAVALLALCLFVSLFPETEPTADDAIGRVLARSVLYLSLHS